MLSLRMCRNGDIVAIEYRHKHLETYAKANENKGYIEIALNHGKPCSSESTCHVSN